MSKLILIFVLILAHSFARERNSHLSTQNYDKYIDKIKSISKQISTNCDKIFPAVIQMAFGVKITNLDIFKPDTGQSNWPAIEFTCNNGNKQSIGSEVFDVPDAIGIILPIYGSISLRFNLHEKTNVELKQSFNAWFSIEEDLIFDSLSASVSFGVASNLILEKQRTFGFAGSVISGYRPAFNPIEPWASNKPKMHYQLQSYYDNVLSKISEFNESTIDVFQYVFDNWHSHYIQSACYGSMIGTTWATSKDYINIVGDTFVEAEGDNDFLVFVKACGGTSEKTHVQVQEWLDATIRTQFTLGGMGVPSPSSYSKWADSGLYYPHLVVCNKEPIKLISLSKLMDKKIGDLFDKAMLNYYDHITIQKYVLTTLNVYISQLNNIEYHINNDNCSDTYPSKCNAINPICTEFWPTDLCSRGIEQSSCCDRKLHCCGKEVNKEYLNITTALSMATKNMLVTIGLLYTDAVNLDQHKIINHLEMISLALRFINIANIMQLKWTEVTCVKQYKPRVCSCGFQYTKINDKCLNCGIPITVCPESEHSVLVSSIHYPSALLQ